jgi:LAO/AO transport system kinase
VVNAGELLARLHRGEPRLLPRLATLVENEDPFALEMLDALYPYTGGAHVVGITGPPGVGKSSLIAALLPLIRQSGRSVGVLAIDPTSPLSGGAVLGDRIRMMDRHADPGVFVRSMASRGRQGGLAWATAELVHLLDLTGFPMVLVETVGVGQDGTDIANLADTVVVVEAPGLGDGVQAIKSGLLEIADVVVLNKADQPGAADVLRTLRSTLGPGTAQPCAIPVLGTTASTGDGLPALIAAIDRHGIWLQESGERVARRERGARAEILAGIRADLERRLSDDVTRSGDLAQIVARVARRDLSPRRAVAHIGSRLAEPVP